jgi:electron transfer flavoprotein alpha subunit
VKKIWIYVEEYQGRINKVAFELIAKAKELGDAYLEPVEIGAVLLSNNAADSIEVLELYGVTDVYVGENCRLGEYCHTTYAPVLADLIKEEDPDVFLFGATQVGSELAPTVAARVRTGLAAHCVNLRIDEGGMMVADVPAFGGKIIGEILVPTKRPQMASVKPGVFTAKECGLPQASRIHKINLCALDRVDLRLVPQGTFVANTSVKPIEDADIVLAGGYGLGSQENWQKLVELAELLGGAVGSTRPCLDEGWADSEETMIGTSGKSIRPKVYLGFGISGATHHVCGMKDANLVITVNKDQKAGIFGVSDYYAVSDVNEILPVLIELIKSNKINQYF